MEATPLRIFEAATSHAEQIHALGDRAFGITWATTFPRVAALEKIIRQVSRNGWVVTVAVDGEQVTGCCVVKPHQGDQGVMLESVWCELAFVAVADGHRGHGLGTHLVADVRQRVLAAGRLGMMATIQSKAVGWYTHMDWHVGEAGHALTIPDVRTRRYGPMVWVHPSRLTHPRWAWTPLDPARPVIAWTTRAGRVAQSVLAEELARQQSAEPV